MNQHVKKIFSLSPSQTAGVMLATLIAGVSPLESQQQPPVQRPPAARQTQAARPPSTVTRRDSARIAIFETKLPATPLPAPFVVDTTPVLRLGDPGPSVDSSSIVRQAVDVAVLRNGSIVVADDADTRLRFFSRYGAFSTAVGGRGSDTGMFFRLKSVDAKGDTVVACCSPGVSLFNAAGKFLTATPPFREEYVGVLANGRFLVRGTTSETNAFQGQKGVIKSLLMDTLFTVDARGTFSGRIAILPSRIHVGVFNPDPNPLGLTVTYLETPFEPESYYATARSGFYFTDGRNIEARLYTTGGQLTRIIRLLKPAPAISATLADSFRQAILRKHAAVVETRRYLEWVLGQYVIPQTLPMVRGMRVAADGRIWMREHSFPVSANASWHVFTAEGVYQGVVSMPSRWTVQQIENEFVVVSQPGSDGRMKVSVHRLAANK